MVFRSLLLKLILSEIYLLLSQKVLTVFFGLYTTWLNIRHQLLWKFQVHISAMPHIFYFLFLFLYKNNMFNSIVFPFCAFVCSTGVSSFCFYLSACAIWIVNLLTHYLVGTILVSGLGVSGENLTKFCLLECTQWISSTIRIHIMQLGFVFSNLCKSSKSILDIFLIYGP